MSPDPRLRIASLQPSSTEILFALGLGRNVVAVSHECAYPPGARRKPVVVRAVIDPERMVPREIDEAVRRAARRGRSLYEVDAARLRELRPDIVFTQDLCEV